MTNVFPQVPDKPIWYDWLYHQTDKDVEMYRVLTEGHSDILECGVGTGRLALPWAGQGKNVHGIDYSENMLTEFREKLRKLPNEISDRITLTHADMRDFDLGKKFSFVCIPFASIVYLLTIEDQLACLRSLRKHLADGGTIVIDIPTWEEAIDEKWLTNDGIMRKVKQHVDPESGKTKEMWSTFRFDSSTQIMEQDRHYRTYDTEGRLEDEQVVLWRSRFFLFGEFQLLLKNVGLAIEKVYGDFSFGTFNHKSEVAVMVIKPVD